MRSDPYSDALGSLLGSRLPARRTGLRRANGADRLRWHKLEVCRGVAALSDVGRHAPGTLARERGVLGPRRPVIVSPRAVVSGA